MKEIKVVKKDSDEHLKRQLKATAEILKNEIADMRRRWNGFIQPIEQKFLDIEKRIDALN